MQYDFLDGKTVAAVEYYLILFLTTVVVVDFCSTFYIEQNGAVSSSALHFMWYRFWHCRVFPDILHGTIVGAFAFCSTLYMVQKCALSSPAQCSISYRSGLCPVLLVCLHGTLVGAGEFYIIFHMVQNWALYKFCSTVYIVQKWSLSSISQNSTSYSGARFRVLPYILHGTDLGPSVFHSTFYIVQNWAVSCSVRYSA